MEDIINHPEHYTKSTIFTNVEPIYLAEQLDFCRGNIVKYIMRAPFKGTELTDLKKALFYAKRYEYNLRNRVITPFTPCLPDYIRDSLVWYHNDLYEVFYGSIYKVIKNLEDTIAKKELETKE